MKLSRNLSIYFTFFVWRDETPAWALKKSTPPALGLDVPTP